MASSLLSGLAQFGSLLMLGGGAFLLVADSADDGDNALPVRSCATDYSAATFNGTFKSDCRTTFAPAEGTVQIELQGGATASSDAVGLERSLRVAGIRPSLASFDCQGVALFDIATATGEHLSCTGARFDGSSTVASCTAKIFADGGTSTTANSCSITFTKNPQ